MPSPPSLTGASAPRRRPELSLTVSVEEGGTVTIVFDPRSGRYFRLRDIEGFLLSLLDGERTLAAVHESVLREYPGIRLSLETVLRFAARMEQLGWLVGSAAAPPRRPPLLRRLLWIKLPPVPADGFFLGVQPLVRLLYQPLTLTVVAMALLAVGYWAFLSAEEYVRLAPSPATPAGAALLLFGVILVGIWHEIGHGVTCRYFGAPCRGVGFFVLYGIPCFYCDVSAAWTLSSRQARLLIGAAGLAWQFVLGAAAFVAWKALEPHTLPARVCHAMVGTCGLTALLNLHPFIKMDGYYLLSDWWRIPNLREKSLAYVRQRFLAFFTTAPLPAASAPRERRILFWFGLGSAVYSMLLVGLLAWRLSSWLVQSFRGTGALLVGVFLMISILSWLQSRRTRRSPQPPAGGGGEGRQEPGPSQPARPAPVRPRPQLLLAFLLVMGVVAWFWTARWSFFIASPCTLEAERRVAVRPDVDGVLREVRYLEGDRVGAGATFAVLESFDLQNDRRQLRQRLRTVEAATQVIRRQAPLVAAEKERDITEAVQEAREARTRLEDQEDLYPIRRAEAERRVQEARAALDAADLVAERTREDERAVAAGTLTPPMQAVSERIERVRAQRGLAEKEVQRAVFLVSQGALQRQKLDTASAELETLAREEGALKSELASLRKELAENREDAEAEVRRLRAAYEAALEGQRLVERETRPEKLDAAREEVAARQAVVEATQKLREAAAVKEAEAGVRRLEAEPIATEIDRLDRKIRETRVTAPAAGVVSTPRLGEKVGRRFRRGETVAWIDRIDTLTARIFVEEKEIGEIRPGLPVQLRVGAFPDRTFEATVAEVSPRTDGERRRGVYEVRVRVQNSRGDLRPGITGYTKIHLGRRPLREVVFRRLNRYLRTEVWTWF